MNDKENLELIKKIKTTENKIEKESLESELLESNYDLIINTINKIDNTSMDNEDLVQEGFIAFLNAIETYDLNKQLSFSKYAESIINTKVRKTLEEYEKSISISKEVADTLNKIIDCEERLENNLGRIPNEDEVAFELGIKIEDYISYKNYAKTVLGDECLENEPTISHMVKHINSHHEETIEDLELENISKSIDLLEDREKEIIKRFYGVGIEKMRIEDISNEFLLSTDRVKEIVTNALDKIKNNLGVN